MIAPYDGYIDDVLNRLPWNSTVYFVNEEPVFSEDATKLYKRELRGLLADAWLAGLGYSLEILGKTT